MAGHAMTRKPDLTPYMFLPPALVLLGIFVVYPIIAVVYYSFTDYDIATPPVWVGLDELRRSCSATRRSAWPWSTRSCTCSSRRS